MEDLSWRIGDLPLHPLLVHFTTVAVPVAAILCIVVALSR